MPRETKPQAQHAPCARLRTRAGAFVCAVSTLALGAALLTAGGPSGLSFVSAAHAQQLPDAATQELFLAVDRNDLDAVRAAIDKGADVEARDFTGTQPVDMAIDRGYFDIAHYLISVRNAAQAQNGGQPALPVPSAEELANAQSPFKSLTDMAAPDAAEQPPMDDTLSPTEAPQSPETDLLAETDLAETPFTEIPQVGPDPFAVSAPSERVAQLEAQPTAPAIDVITPEQPEPSAAAGAEQPENEKPEVAQKTKASAAKTFITTFFDFFKPPNVTGVTRRETDRKQIEEGLSDEELAKQLHAIEAERGDEVIKGPDVPISPEELAKQLPPSPDLGDLTPEEIAALSADMPALPPYSVDSVSTPMPAPEDAFGDLTIDEVTLDDEQPLATAPQITQPRDTASIPAKPGFTEAPGVPGKRYDPTKPFGGGVDPDILAWLGLDERTGRTSQDAKQKQKDQKTAATAQPAVDDPFASPFETLDGAEAPAVSDLLEGLDEPQDIASIEPKSPPSPDGAPDGAPTDDPFATLAPPAGAADDPFSSPAPPPGGDVDELAGLLEMTGESVKGSKGWDVTKVEGANLPSEATVVTEIEPTGEVLDGVELALGADTVIGQEVGEDRIKLLDQETIHKPCISKGGTETVFCIDTVSWPFELEESFLVDTIMYQGTRAVARYDAGRATNFHSLFRTEAFDNIISYYTKRYGQPTQMIERAIAPLAAPRQENPTYLWQSREPGTDTVTTLEIRKFDDAQTGFPDINRGVLLLYRSHAKPIFPQLSQLELMVLKADAAVPVESTAPTPGDVWN